MNSTDDLFLFHDATPHSREVDEWLSGSPTELYSLARQWFAVFRECGDDVDELVHDGCPTACIKGAAFGYVNVFSSHINVGFYRGAFIDDPSAVLVGTGKRMRHVKLNPSTEIDSTVITKLIHAAHADMKTRLIT